MFKLIGVVVLLSASNGALQNTNMRILDGKIVGGWPASIRDFPYQLSLLLNEEHVCGASLISPKFAVTAAHCTFESSPSSLSIRAGSSFRNLYGIVAPVKEIHQHPSYNPSTYDYDISVLELDFELPLDDSITPIALPITNQQVEAGFSSIVSGWGALSENGFLSDQLQAVQIQTVGSAECADAYSFIPKYTITERMICAGVPEGGKDSCQGDSGGPLVFNGQLIGIVSWGHGCARPGIPGVYASVPVLREFISEKSGI